MPESFRMPPTTFTKTAVSPNDLLTKLQGQGLIIDDKSTALAYLQYVGGYRLKGYWHHLIDKKTKKFPPDCKFSNIADRCEFDREIRSATIEAIDRLEVAIRSVISNSLSTKHGPHWFLNSSIFKPTAKSGLGSLLQKIETEVKRENKKNFVKHYLQAHDDPYLPPSWAIAECVSFGLWSRTYEILRESNDKKAISMKFGIDQTEVFQSWIHSITVTRNIVAHNGQLLRTFLSVAPCNYTKKQIIFNNNKYFFSVATAIQFLLVQIGLPNRWQNDLQEIFKKYPAIDIGEIGFQLGWENTNGW